MNLLNLLERKLSINKIILLPIFIGLLPFLVISFLLPISTKTGELLAALGLFISGFSGFLMIHYKQIPGGNVHPKIAIFLGLLTTIICWVNFLIYILDKNFYR